MSEHGFVEGDHYIIDDETGLKIRASESRRRWDGHIVHRDVWEQRHPQDLVKGRIDRQIHGPVRPQGVDAFIGPLRTNIALAAAAGQTSIRVVSAVRMLAGDRIAIMLANGDTWATTINTVTDTENFVIPGPGLPSAIEVGAQVVNYTAMATPQL